MLQNVAIVCCAFHSLLVSRICCCPVSDCQKIHNPIHGPSHSIDTDNRSGIHSIDNGTTHSFVYCLSCLLGYCPYIIALYVSNPQSSSTTTTITQPRSLLPHRKLHTDCNCNTVVGFDHSSKLQIANAAPSLVSVCSPILQHFFFAVELGLTVRSFS